LLRNIDIAYNNTDIVALHGVIIIITIIYYLVCEAIGTAATPGLLCQPRVIMMMIVEKQMEYRLTGQTEVLGESLPKRHIAWCYNVIGIRT
jgi:hypothetical protein